MTSASKQQLPDFVSLYRRYQSLAGDGGFRSQLGKRVSTPEELSTRPAFYRLFSGERPPSWGERVAFFLPWCAHADEAKPLGQQLAEARISEARLFQVVRSESPNDLIQLRRLLQHIEPTVNWQHFGTQLLYWGESAKRTLIEDFFIHQTVKAN